MWITVFVVYTIHKKIINSYIYIAKIHVADINSKTIIDHGSQIQAIRAIRWRIAFPVSVIIIILL